MRGSRSFWTRRVGQALQHVEPSVESAVTTKELQMRSAQHPRVSGEMDAKNFDWVANPHQS
jgi:hypothetical protein